MRIKLVAVVMVDWVLDCSMHFHRIHTKEGAGMKKLALTIGVAIIGILVGFFACSFYYVSFDIQKWTSEGRFMCLMLMTVGAFIGSGIVQTGV